MPSCQSEMSSFATRNFEEHTGSGTYCTKEASLNFPVAHKTSQHHAKKTIHDLCQGAPEFACRLHGCTALLHGIIWLC